MALESIKTSLENKFDVKCYINLDSLHANPSSYFYNQLIEHIEPRYEPNCRFVLFNFSPLNQETLDHVSWTIDYLDISPYFVLLISNQPDTINFFDSQANPITTELVSDAIDTNVGEVGVTPLYNRGNMCAHAWTGLHVDPNGSVRICCEYQDQIKDSTGQKYNIRNDSIETIMSSDYMNDIRQQFRDGKTPIGCASCVQSEKHNGESKRSLTPYKLENIYGKINWESDSIDNLGFIGGHLGNLCNLSCRICSPIYSSSIATEELQDIPSDQLKHNPTYQLLSENRWSKNSDKFWSRLREHVPKIRNFEFLGGEPLLLKENIEFMQYLLDQGYSQDSIFEFVTNGTQYSDIFDQADKFKRLTITVSIDNIGKRFELERHGSSWSQVEENIQRFIKLKKTAANLNVGVCITVNIQNVLYLPEIIDWLNIQNFDYYYFNILNEPSFLSINQLTPTAKELVLTTLQSNKNYLKLDYVISCVNKSETSDGKKFCQYMKEKDLIRNENFADTHSEIANAMGYKL